MRWGYGAGKHVAELRKRHVERGKPREQATWLQRQRRGYNGNDLYTPAWGYQISSVTSPWYGQSSGWVQSPWRTGLRCT